MTMMGGRFPQGKDDVGRTVAEYATYEAAQKAVSSLISSDVPARQIAIVGRGLRSIERVTGRLGYAAAARSGAVNGLLLGMLFSAFLVLASESVPIQAFVGVLFLGIAIGMLLSIVTYALVRRRRDFASVMQVVADHYDVTVAADSFQRARQVLGTAVAPAAPRPDAGHAAADEPPRYGQREPSSGPPKYGERVAPTAPTADGPAVPEAPAGDVTRPEDPGDGAASGR